MAYCRSTVLSHTARSSLVIGSAPTLFYSGCRLARALRPLLAARAKVGRCASARFVRRHGASTHEPTGSSTRVSFHGGWWRMLSGAYKANTVSLFMREGECTRTPRTPRRGPRSGIIARAVHLRSRAPHSSRDWNARSRTEPPPAPLTPDRRTSHPQSPSLRRSCAARVLLVCCSSQAAFITTLDASSTGDGHTTGASSNPVRAWLRGAPAP